MALVPLIKPDVQISCIRLSQQIHESAIEELSNFIIAPDRDGGSGSDMKSSRSVGDTGAGSDGGGALLIALS